MFEQGIMPQNANCCARIRMEEEDVAVQEAADWAKDEADAVRIANDSPFGLGGSVFTTDVAHGVEVAKKISTGMVFVNHPTKVEADLPFGGVRRSGYGRELLGLGLKEFINHKLIDVVDIDAHF